MIVDFQCGDSITIPEGCKAVIEDGKVIFQTEFKDADYVPKRGDIVVCTYHVPYSTYNETVTAICTGHRGKYGTYDCFVQYEHGGIIKRNKGIPVVEKHDQYQSKLRLATDEEKEILFDKMKEQGLKWNAEEKRIEKIRWRAKEGEEYSYVNSNMEVSSCRRPKKGDYKCDYEGNSYISYNYFRTQEQTTEAAKRVKDTLRKYHEEIGE